MLKLALVIPEVIPGAYWPDAVRIKIDKEVISFSKHWTIEYWKHVMRYNHTVNLSALKSSELANSEVIPDNVEDYSIYDLTHEQSGYTYTVVVWEEK